MIGPRNSKNSMNGKASQPGAPPLRLNISPMFGHRLSASPHCQRTRWLRSERRSVGTSVQHTGSGTNTMR
jgi:hypothetical protein